MVNRILSSLVEFCSRALCSSPRLSRIILNFFIPAAPEIIHRFLRKQSDERLKSILTADNAALLKRIFRNIGLAAFHEAVEEQDYSILRRLIEQDDYNLFKKLAAHNQWMPIKEALRHMDTQEVKWVLAVNDYHVLQEVLFSDDAQVFREVGVKRKQEPLKQLLRETDAAVLKSVLVENNHHLLQEILFSDKARVFREVAGKQRRVPLIQFLRENDLAVLRGVLAGNNFELLQEILFSTDFKVFREMARKRQGAPLKRILAENDYELLYSILCSNEESLFPLLAMRQEFKLMRTLLGAPDASVMTEFLRNNQGAYLEKLLIDHDLITTAMNRRRILGVIELHREWERIEGALPQGDPTIREKFSEAKKSIRDPGHIRGRILDAITRDDLVRLAHGVMKSPDRHSLWTLLKEVLVNEDYFFETEKQDPYIIDGGAHAGFSLYFFKVLYPGARIVGFEPVPHLKEVAVENVARNRFDNVTIYPYALAGTRGTRSFQVSNTFSMAGSLTGRREEFGDSTHEIEVDCRRLSEFLQEEVDFLKLDIEGAELEVLEEARSHLHQVRHLFCEVHMGMGTPKDTLSRILAILVDEGFECHVAKSENFQQTSRTRPMTAIGKGASFVLWAKRV